MAAPRLNESGGAAASLAVEIVTVRLSLGEAAAERLHGLLDDEERVRAARFVKLVDRVHWTVARARLRQILAHYLACETSEVEFGLDTYRKPHIDKPVVCPRITFNLSHSGDYMQLAVAESIPIGIDIEQVKAFDNLAQVAERFFAPEESSALLELRDAQRIEPFFRCWTRKEAVLKAVGTGLSTPLDAFVVDFIEQQPCAMRWLRDWGGPRPPVELAEIAAPAGYAAALAVQRPAGIERLAVSITMRGIDDANDALVLD